VDKALLTQVTTSLVDNTQNIIKKFLLREDFVQLILFLLSVDKNSTPKLAHTFIRGLFDATMAPEATPNILVHHFTSLINGVVRNCNWPGTDKLLQPFTPDFIGLLSCKLYCSFALEMIREHLKLTKEEFKLVQGQFSAPTDVLSNDTPVSDSEVQFFLSAQQTSGPLHVPVQPEDFKQMIEYLSQPNTAEALLKRTLLRDQEIGPEQDIG
jgi:hypothetical protein